MKLSEEFSTIQICSTTGKRLDPMRHVARSVCPFCGHHKILNHSHYKTIVGHWNQPSTLWETLTGKESVFVPLKEQNDSPDLY